jgi:methyl-accepting chemotaxis protein
MRESIHVFQDALKKAVKYNVSAADASAKASDEQSASARRDVVIGSLVMGLLCVAVAFYMQRAIVLPVRALTGVMARLAGGETRIEIPGVARSDEIGEMARASAVFQNAAVERRVELEREVAKARAAAIAERGVASAERERAAHAQAKAMQAIAEALRALASGDLQQGIASDFPNEFKGLRDSFEEARDKLNATMRAVASSSALLADEIGELSGGAHELSTRAEQQAASLEESAAALHQITATVKASKDGVTRARTVVAAADNEAKRGAQVIDQAVAAMNGLSQSAREIREITGLIDEIAFQTNLLALNAGVEAARVGGAGRGFAVVATEVRALAQRSADMAKRISDLISNSDRQVQAGVAKVDATGEALGRIAGEVGRLNEIVDSIAQGAADQARGLDEISAAMRELEQTTQSNAGMAGRTSAATQRVSQEIGSLDGRMRQFRFALDSDHLKAVRRAHVRAHA